MCLYFLPIHFYFIIKQNTVLCPLSELITANNCWKPRLVYSITNHFRNVKLQSHTWTVDQCDNTFWQLFLRLEWFIITVINIFWVWHVASIIHTYQKLRHVWFSPDYDIFKCCDISGWFVSVQCTVYWSIGKICGILSLWSSNVTQIRCLCSQSFPFRFYL